jgi:hypothetical protein
MNQKCNQSVWDHDADISFDPLSFEVRAILKNPSSAAGCKRAVLCDEKDSHADPKRD